MKTPTAAALLEKLTTDLQNTLTVENADQLDRLYHLILTFDVVARYAADLGRGDEFDSEIFPFLAREMREPGELALDLASTIRGHARYVVEVQKESGGAQ